MGINHQDNVFFFFLLLLAMKNKVVEIVIRTSSELSAGFSGGEEGICLFAINF